MVERPLRMREVVGSMPTVSTLSFPFTSLHCQQLHEHLQRSLWCSWLSRQSNTLKVSSSNLDRLKLCNCSPTVGYQPSKLRTRVRLPAVAVCFLSTVVVRSLRKGEVGSSILPGSSAPCFAVLLVCAAPVSMRSMHASLAQW